MVHYRRRQKRTYHDHHYEQGILIRKAFDLRVQSCIQAVMSIQIINGTPALG